MESTDASHELWQENLDLDKVYLATTMEKTQQLSAFIKLLIPDLSLILAQGNESTHKISIRYQKHARQVPEPPLKWLVRLPDNTDYTLRRETAHTSQKTGSTAVLKLQACLGASSPRIRSNTLSILNHLMRFDVGT